MYQPRYLFHFLSRPTGLTAASPPRPIPRRWLMKSLHHAALGFQMLVRRVRVDVGRLARPRSREGQALVLKTGKRREMGAPDAAPGTSLPIATRGSVYTADMSLHAEFRWQVVSLSSGSCYSISAMIINFSTVKVINK